MATAAEVRAARDRFAAAELPVYESGDTVCRFARQEKVWVNDPDGNTWEVYFFTDATLAEHGQNPEGDEIVHFVPDASKSQGASVPAYVVRVR